MPPKRRSARRQGRRGHSNVGARGSRQQQREDASVQDMSLPQLLEMVRDEVRAEWQANQQARQTGSGNARVSFATGTVAPSSTTATATGAVVGSGPGAAIAPALAPTQGVIYVGLLHVCNYGTSLVCSCSIHSLLYVPSIVCSMFTGIIACSSHGSAIGH